MRLLSHLLIWLYLVAALAQPAFVGFSPAEEPVGMVCHLGDEGGSCCDPDPESEALPPCCTPERGCQTEQAQSLAGFIQAYCFKARQESRTKVVPRLPELQVAPVAPAPVLAGRISAPFKARASLPDGQGLFLRLENLRT